MNSRSDNLGDRMKAYESQTTNNLFMPNLPLYARLDGRSFHSFCRGLDTPFDTEFRNCMGEVCKYLVKETNANLGYVQSDEVSLGWENLDKAPFDGRVFKLLSVLASMATVKFILECSKHEKLEKRVQAKLPNFDCRVFQLPNMEELANCFVWRELDASRNSVSMLAQANFSHKQLQGKSSKEMQEMLFQEKGINYNDLNPSLKRGSYFQRVAVEKLLDEIILQKLPEDKRPLNNMVMRTVVQELNLPIMSKVLNKVGTYFHKEEPVLPQLGEVL